MPRRPRPRPPPCPRCGGTRVHRWGQFAGKQRHRCVACGRTFSANTGTPLHYLKRSDRWDDFCVAMDRSLSVRRAAALLGIHRDTAFRWRHRLLRDVLERGTHRPLRGPVVVGDTTFPFSRKGARTPAPSPAVRRVAVLIGRDPGGHARFATHAHPLRVDEMTTTLSTWLATGCCRIVGARGKYAPLAVAARRLGVRHEALADYREKARGPGSPRDYVVRLRRWLRRFRGVATRYLLHYLIWFHGLGSAPP